MIKHIWFDFSETIARLHEDRHNELRYSTYASVVEKSVNEDLKKEYEQLYIKSKHSNAAIFRSLGLPSDFWSQKVNSLAPQDLYTLADPDIPKVLKKLKTIVPISIFSNLKLGDVLPALGIDISLFTHVLSAEMLKEPKPALEGFYKMVELSQLPPSEILYIGDNVGKDVLPAKKVGIRTGLMWDNSKKADYCFNGFKEIFSVFK
ncbi:MAG TPA: HAD family hydrolase [Patescibacteria group bacterium]|nr:HAD family hydrolase [Patescibacteria group bacterium]